MVKVENGLLLENIELGDKYFLLTVLAPELALEAKPGQFFQIKTGEGTDPFLRRPISVHSLDENAGLIEFLIEKKGKGTFWLSRKTPGDKINILGPLGKGFTIKKTDTLLIGGGIGVAPLLALGDALQKIGRKPITFLGANTEKDILRLKNFMNISKRVQITTIDGSVGKKGLVTELLIRELENGFKGFIYACGPEGMLFEVAKLAEKYNLQGEASLEARMACGFGVCLGCNCNIKKEEKDEYYHVCVDGPVFPLEVLANYDGN